MTAAAWARTGDHAAGFGPVVSGPDAVRRRSLTVGCYVAVLVLLAVPICRVTVPPLVDYPNHLARMHVLAAYAASPELRANYAVAWQPSPYLGMDAIVPWLVRFMSVYTAGRVFLYLCLVQLVIGTAAVHAALHRRLSPWPAASALFAYSFIVSYGFMNYLFGAGVWLLAFAGWIVLSRRSRAARIAGGSILAAAVFFGHFFAFLGYALCVAAYEFGVWRAGPQRHGKALLERGVTAFIPFVIPLALFAALAGGQEGGVTLFATPPGWFVAMLSPVVFPGAPDLAILSAALIVPARRGAFGAVRLAGPMRYPLAALGAIALIMPNTLMGVWGADYRFPVVVLLLLIASCSWHRVPARTGVRLAFGLIALLALNIGSIVWSWRPLELRFEEFRSALSAIPRGASVLAFRDDAGIDPALTHEPAALFDHLPALAVIERDAYVPFLFKNPMMPVTAAPARRLGDTPVGKPISLADLFAGAEPASVRMLGAPEAMGARNFWADWPDRYDYVVELAFGAHPVLPRALTRVASGRIFNIYRVTP